MGKFLLSVIIYFLIVGNAKPQNNDGLLKDYKYLIKEDWTSPEKFNKKIFKGDKIDKKNFNKINQYKRARDNFNSQWENKRVLERTKMNESISRLLLIKSKYQLLESQFQSVTSEIDQIKTAIDQNQSLISKYQKTDQILGTLKDNIVNNYMYYGIFFVEFDVPKNEKDVLHVNVESYRDYGVYLIKETIRQNYVDALVSDSIFVKNGIVSLSREMIKEVEMLNVVASFHTSLLQKSSDDLKHIVVAAALFKNDGSQNLRSEQQSSIIGDTITFKVLNKHSSVVDRSILYSSEERGINDRLSVLGRIEKSDNTSGSKLDIKERFEVWFEDARKAFTNIDTKEAKTKWIEELGNYNLAQQKMNTERLQAERQLSVNKEKLKTKKTELQNLEIEKKYEKQNWELEQPKFITSSKSYYKMVQKQKYYDFYEASLSKKGGNVIDATYQAVNTSIKDVVDGRGRELIKTVVRDVRGISTSDTKAVRSIVSVKKVALLDHSHLMDNSGVSVTVPLAIEMSLEIPQTYIKRTPEPSPPWRTVEYDEKEMVLRDLINLREWKRIKKSSDENEYGNAFDETMINDWRLPSIEELHSLEIMLSDYEAELKQMEIIVNNPYPFWSTTDANNKDVSRSKKRCLIVENGRVNEVDLEITDQGYFLYVKDVNRAN